MKAVYALYSDGESAQRAVNGLRAAGIADSGITVISGEPMEDFEFSEMNKDTWIWYMASAGGFAGWASAGAQASSARSARSGKRHLFNYDPTSFRREYSAIRIPKPASTVTTELPP